jgi:hypothetical protein
MFTAHRAQVRYISTPTERLAWRLTMALPKRFANGNRLGKWRTTQSEWLFVHKRDCLCQGCDRAR